MNKQEIREIIDEILIDNLRISKTEICLVSTLKDLGADSLDEVDIILKLEQEFGIHFPDEIMPESLSVGNLYRYIVENI